VAPLFFVSVASKGFTHAVSLLFATLAGIFISVAAKGLMGEFSEVWQGTEFGDREYTSGQAREETGRLARMGGDQHSEW
jgi:hypothetical protein